MVLAVRGHGGKGIVQDTKGVEAKARGIVQDTNGVEAKAKGMYLGRYVTWMLKRDKFESQAQTSG